MAEDKSIKTKIKEIEDKRISFAVIFQLCLLITNYTVKYLLNINDETVRAFVSLLFMIIAGFLFIKNINIVIKRIGRVFFATYSISIFFFLISIMVNNEVIPYIINVSFWYFIICLPVFLYYLSIINKSIFLEMLIKSAYYQIFIGLIFMLTTFIREPVYDMTFSYQMMVPVIILMYKTQQKLNLFDLLLIIFGVISIVAIGSRGPLVAILVYIIMSFITYTIENIKLGKTALFSVSILSIISLFLLFLDEILRGVNYFLVSRGINSRMLYLFLNENIDFLTGRGPIYEAVLVRIMERPILGFGIAGDRIFLDGGYPHNVFLEILVQFGIVLGSFILMVLLCFWICGIFLNKNKIERSISIMFFSIGVVGLLFSSSYLINSNFWLFLASCLPFLARKNRRIPNMNVKGI